MKKLLITLVILTSCAIIMIGCGTPAPTTQAPTTPAPAAPAKPAAPTPAAPAPAPAAPAAPTTPGVQYGGTLKIIGVGGPAVFGYPPESDPISAGASRPCLDGLFYLDKNGNPLPRLITDWEVSKDGKTITCSLRKGVKFHDGTDFNAEAVKWNVDINMKSLAPFMLTSTDVVDPYTVRFNLSQYNNSIFNQLAFTVVISPTAFQKNGIEWTRVNPVGTGPFKFVDFKRDVYAKYTKFNDYWDKGKPYLDGIELLYFADQTTAVMAFEAGGAQIFASTSGKNAADLKAKGYNIRAMPGITRFLAWDSANSDSPFSNQKVREAVEYAIDKVAIAKAVGYGFMYGTNQLCPNEYAGYNTDLTGRNYDPAKAKQLLKEAGYPTGFKTRLIATVTDDRDALVAIQTFLKEVGIEVTLDLGDRARYEQVRREGWKNALMLGGTGTDTNMNQRLSADLGATSPFYAPMLRPPDWQMALIQSMAARDIESRKLKLQQLMVVTSETAFVCPLWVSYDTGAMTKAINCDYLTFHKIMWKHSDAWLSK